MTAWDGWASELVATLPSSIVGAGVGAGAAIWIMRRTLADQQKSTRDQLAEQRRLLEESAQSERAATRTDQAAIRAADLVSDLQRMSGLFFGTSALSLLLPKLESLSVSAAQDLNQVRILLRGDGEGLYGALYDLLTTTSTTLTEAGRPDGSLPASPTAGSVAMALDRSAFLVASWFGTDSAQARADAESGIKKLAAIVGGLLQGES